MYELCSVLELNTVCLFTDNVSSVILLYNLASCLFIVHNKGCYRPLYMGPSAGTGMKGFVSDPSLG